MSDSDSSSQPGEANSGASRETNSPEATQRLSDLAQSASSTENEDLSGIVLGEFRLLRRLGKGGMANVYLAEQTTLSRKVAVKVMKDELVTSASYLERFKAEAMAAANLNHINIVQVYTIGEANGYHYIAQEYVQGKNLREFISRKGPPELSVAIHILRQIASALQKAGEVGIVHRDIKPENILISSKGVVKIADFGLAQLTLGGERMNLTQEGVTMGTPLYMSPEQVQGNKVDQRSDIYSLGVTTYHLFAGRPPFRGETAIAIAMKHVNNQPAPLSKRRPDLSPAICNLVHKMMAKKVDERYQNAGEILADLRRAVKETEGDDLEVHQSDFQAKSIVVSPKTKKPLRTVSRKKFILLGLLCLLLGVGAGVFARPRLTPEPELNSTHQPGSREQLAQAILDSQSEDAWKSLREYYPNSPERWQAEERLAILHLNAGRFDQASQIFESFIEDPVAQKEEMLPSGFAGRAVMHTLRGEYQTSDRILFENSKRISEKLTGPLLPLVRQAIEENEKELNSPRMTVEKMFPDEAPVNEP